MAARNLKKGSTGSDVLQLQKDLQTVGYYTTGKLDGIFGRQTDRAVRSFQQANKLKVDGVVGPKTRAALAAKVNAKKGKKNPNTVQGGRPKGGASAATVETGRWNGHKFTLSPGRIFSFTNLQIKGGSELESSSDKKKKKEYVKRDQSRPAEVSLTVNLNAFAGCNPRRQAIAFIKEASEGGCDYFYVGNKKLLPCKLMLVDASVKEVEVSRDSTWTKASVQLTMKQASKFESWSKIFDDAKNGGKKKFIGSGLKVFAPASTGSGSEIPTVTGIGDLEKTVIKANGYAAQVRAAAKKATTRKLTTVNATKAGKNRG